MDDNLEKNAEEFADEVEKAAETAGEKIEEGWQNVTESAEDIVEGTFEPVNQSAARIPPEPVEPISGDRWGGPEPVETPGRWQGELYTPGIGEPVRPETPQEPQAFDYIPAETRAPSVTSREKKPFPVWAIVLIVLAVLCLCAVCLIGGGIGIFGELLSNTY